MDVKTAATSDLVAAYNKLTGSSIKRFATRKDAERRMLKALSDADAKALAGNGRAVKLSSGKVGRPTKEFSVKLLDGAKMKINSKSIRRNLVNWLTEQPERTASISAIEKHFGRDMRGVIRQLADAKWVERIEAAEGAK